MARLAMHVKRKCMEETKDGSDHSHLPEELPVWPPGRLLDERCARPWPLDSLPSLDSLPGLPSSTVCHSQGMIMNHLKICLPVWAGGPYKLTQPNLSFCSCSELLPEAVLAAALCCVSMGGEQHVRQSVIQAEGPRGCCSKSLISGFFPSQQQLAIWAPGSPWSG